MFYLGVPKLLDLYIAAMLSVYCVFTSGIMIDVVQRAAEKVPRKVPDEPQTKPKLWFMSHIVSDLACFII